MDTLTEFFELVKERIAAEGCTAEVVFGRQHLVRRDFQGPGSANKIVLAPGSPDGTAAEQAAPIHVHVTVKPDRYLERQYVTAQVWGYNKSSPSDQMKQHEACRLNAHAMCRSIQHVLRVEGHKHNFYQAKQSYPLLPNERRHGEMAQLIFWVGFNVRDIAPTQVVNDAEVEPLQQQTTLASGEVVIEG